MCKSSASIRTFSRALVVGGALLLCQFALAHAGYTPPVTNRVETDFNRGWKYREGDVTGGAQATAFNDGMWEAVVLPHTTKFVTRESPAAYIGISWYRKHFTVDPSYQGKKVYLRFGAAMQAADVYINGTQVGTQNVGGYMEFTLDITGAISYTAENVVAVKINSAANPDWGPGQANVDFRYHGGLYRDVVLYTTDKLHVTDAVFANRVAGGGVYVSYPSMNSTTATISIKTDVFNENTASKSCTVVSEIEDRTGTIVQTATSTVSLGANIDSAISQSISMTSPHFWSPDAPYLYILHTTVKDGSTPVDYCTTRIGIRTIKWTRTSGLQINGQSFRVQGANLHQDIYGLGNAISKRSIYFEVKRMKEAGMQYIRCAHYPHNPAFYDACDEWGILVEDCISGWQFYTNTSAFNNNTYKESKDLIRRDRNHPCIAVWETQLNESGYTTEWAAAVNNLAHAEGSQFITCGTLAGNWGDASGSANTPWDVGLGASQHGVRSNTATQPYIIGEYGDWDYGGVNSTSRVWREGGEDSLLRQALNIQESLNSNRGLSWYSADAYWMWSDNFGGFPVPTVINCGVMDMFRIPKFAYYFFQSQRNPAVVIPNASSGPMVYIANRWTAASPTTIRVFSNCEKVSLYRNNTLIATQSPDNDGRSTHLLHPPFTFANVTFAAGELKAVGLIGGVEKATHSRKTPGTAAAINLRAENDTLLADGSDTRLVWIDVVDANGTVVPTSSHKVDLSIVSGPGAIVGPASVTMLGGRLATWVRGATTSGRVIVAGACQGLTTGYDTLTSGNTVATRPLSPATASTAAMTTGIFKVTGAAFNVPGNFTGRALTISLYDLSRKLLKTAAVKNRTIGIRKDMGMPEGIYIARVKTVR